MCPSKPSLFIVSLGLCPCCSLNLETLPSDFCYLTLIHFSRSNAHSSMARQCCPWRLQINETSPYEWYTNYLIPEEDAHCSSRTANPPKQVLVRMAQTGDPACSRDEQPHLYISSPCIGAVSPPGLVGTELAPRLSRGEGRG